MDTYGSIFQISRPVSLIEERVEDFHTIHEVGSCELLSSSVPQISVPLPLDTILTHPISPSKTFEFTDKSEEEELKKDFGDSQKDGFWADYCYTSTKRKLCYRSSIRIMVRPENLLHMQQQDAHHHHNPAGIPRSNSLEGISSTSSSSNSSTNEGPRAAKKMSAASLARHKNSSQRSPGGDDCGDTAFETTQPSIVKEQFR